MRTHARSLAMLAVATSLLAAACTVPFHDPEVGCEVNPKEIGCPRWVPDASQDDVGDAPSSNDAEGDAAAAD